MKTRYLTAALVAACGVAVSGCAFARGAHAHRANYVNNESPGRMKVALSREAYTRTHPNDQWDVQDGAVKIGEPKSAVDAAWPSCYTVSYSSAGSIQSCPNFADLNAPFRSQAFDVGFDANGNVVSVTPAPSP